jgi:hypothetical protein
MSDDEFLFPEDREKERSRQEWERKSRIYGTPEFGLAYAVYTRSSKWKKLCAEVKRRAGGRRERCGPHVIQFPPYSVHHLTYDRFMNERLTDLRYLCMPCHSFADRERERANRRAYEEAGKAARDAAGMNTYFTKRYGDDWADQFGSDIGGAYEEWCEWKRDKDEEY